MPVPFYPVPFYPWSAEWIQRWRKFFGTEGFRAVLLSVLVFWIFTPALRGEWLFDDDIGILENPVMHRWTGLWDIWFAPRGPEYFPLKSTVQWVQWHFFGKDLLGYHLTNVALHLAGAFLVWRLFVRLGVPLAWFGALFFAVHPVTVESVAWMSELKNTLSLPLLLAAMLAYLRHDHEGDPIFYVYSLLAFLAAMLSKTSVVMFPVVILLYAWWRHGKVRTRDWCDSVPFFAISLVLGVTTMLLQRQVEPETDPIEMLDPLSRALCAAMSMAFYVGKCFWPMDLDVPYFRWNVQAAAGWEWLFLLLFAFFAGWLVTRRQPWSRHALFGFGFFLINLAPVLGFIRMSWQRYAWTADHFLYLPLVGVAGLVAAGAGNLHDLYPQARRALFIGMALVVGVLAWKSHDQAKLFRSSITLWTHHLLLDPSSWIGYNNLGVALAAAGRGGEAIHQFQRTLTLNPNQSLAYINWGNALMGLGRIDEALHEYHEAETIRPDDTLARYLSGNALVEGSRFSEAIDEYHRALRVNPGLVEARNSLANAYIQSGKMNEAIDEERRAIVLDPDNADAHDNLGIALGNQGRIPEAVDEFREAVRLSPDDPEVHCNLAIALLKAGNTEEAIGQFRETLLLNPQDERAGRMLQSRGM